MIVTVVGTATTEVVIANVGETVCPSNTTTDAGTVAAGSLLVNCTVIPPTGATPISVTLLAAAVTLPTTEAGATVSAIRIGRLTTKFAVPPKFGGATAEMDTVESA